ncbi:SDR family oxidoreductase [Actinobacteria bacterium YIM 96077]|uniref:Short-chain dehydrogenase n=1 Tax=Phytoactinopolyspora halophila TaxID=1981511 RepID=A0A329QFV7_9ACTN|nr:SDR family oxidoreductase [Phytoactinopolyspora halophila]AYY13636.1 SDR family oxidoreductase [Actinobacteria bacterium YIM 96077]RAW11200.1 short-chain dehydrogenase [Phytoactinopolyspora halophila]
MTVAGQRVLITGANRGIGRELALGLAGHGWEIGLLGRDEEALERVARECRERGRAAVSAVADVVDRDAVDAAVERVATALGGLDLLVNNAGVIEPAEQDFVSADLEETWRVMEVNVRGPMVVSHAALRRMLPAGGGRIVNINSGAGHKVMTAYTGYAVSKGALMRLTTQLDAQYRDRGIYVFDVAPGHVKTDMTAPMPMHAGRTDWTPPQAVVDLVAGIGSGRLDELAGRYVRAGADTVEALLERRAEIVERDARALRLSS